MRIRRIRKYDGLLNDVRNLERRLERQFLAMSVTDTGMDDLDSQVFNGLGSAQCCLQSAAFIIRMCQLADESKINNQEGDKTVGSFEACRPLD